MNKNRDYIQQLVNRFNAGEAAASEIAEIESLLEQGILSIDDLQPLSGLHAQVHMLETPSPSASLDSNFYEMLSAEKRKQRMPAWKQFFSWPEFAPRFSMAMMMLLSARITSHASFTFITSRYHRRVASGSFGEKRSLRR